MEAPTNVSLEEIAALHYAAGVMEVTQTHMAKQAAAVLNRLLSAPTMALHRYYSTACHHGKHEECRQHCKFCEDNCRCACHVKEQP